MLRKLQYLLSILYLVGFLTVSCATTKTVYKVDPILQPYVEQFEKIGNFKIKNLIVKFAVLKEEVLGQCTYGRLPKVEINMLRVNDKSNPAYVESIMFHELGHCILLRGHSESTDSIMYPTLMHTYYYIENYKNYISELFHINYTKEFDPNVYNN